MDNKERKLEVLVFALLIINLVMVIWFANLSVRYADLKQEDINLSKHLSEISDKQIETMKLLLKEHGK